MGDGIQRNSNHINPHLGSFLAAHPDLNIDIMQDDRDVDLIEEGIDVATRLAELSDSTFAARKLGQCQPLVLATPAYLSGAGEPVVPNDLAAWEYVDYMLAVVAQHGSLQIALNRSQWICEAVFRAAVLANFGFTIASEWMSSPELKSAVSLDWELPAIDLWAVFTTGRQVSARARAFATFIKEQVGPAAEGTPQPRIVKKHRHKNVGRTRLYVLSESPARFHMKAERAVFSGLLRWHDKEADRKLDLTSPAVHEQFSSCDECAVRGS